MSETIPSSTLPDIPAPSGPDMGQWDISAVNPGGLAWDSLSLSNGPTDAGHNSDGGNVQENISNTEQSPAKKRVGDLFKLGRDFMVGFGLEAQSRTSERQSRRSDSGYISKWDAQRGRREAELGKQIARYLDGAYHYEHREEDKASRRAERKDRRLLKQTKRYLGKLALNLNFGYRGDVLERGGNEESLSNMIEGQGYANKIKDNIKRVKEARDVIADAEEKIWYIDRELMVANRRVEDAQSRPQAIVGDRSTGSDNQPIAKSELELAVEKQDGLEQQKKELLSQIEASQRVIGMLEESTNDSLERLLGLVGDQVGRHEV